MDREAEHDGRREALIQAGLILASELSLPAVLQKIADLASEVADARYVALGVLDRAGTGLADFVTYGVTEDERRVIGNLPEGKGLLGALIEEAHTLRLHNIQEDPRSVGFPANHPPMTSFLGVPVKIGGKVFGNLYLTEKRGGGDFTDEDATAVEVLATQAAVAIENASLYEDARRREAQLTAASEVTHAILEGRATDEVLQLITSHAQELARADLASLTTPDPSGDGLVVRTASGRRAADVLGMRFSQEDSASGEAIRTRRPLLLEDASSDPRVNQPIVRIGGIGPSLLVPLRVEERAFGTLLVANEVGGRSFTHEDLALVGVFAGQAAVALELGRVHAELQRLAVLEDRERIAQDLHDGVVQSLFAVGMSIQAADSLVGDEEVRSRLSGAVEGIDRTIRDLRNYIFALGPGGVADRQVVRAIRDVAAEFGAATEIAIVVDADPDTAAELSSMAADILQASREALSNAIRHAEAETVSIRLRREGDTAVLEIEDDGTGFVPDEVSGEGHGLGNLLARAEAMRGKLEILPAHPGTIVRLRIPLV